MTDTTTSDVLEYLGGVDSASKSDIASALDISQSDVDAHLRVLMNEGAISPTVDWDFQADTTDGSELEDRMGKEDEVVRSDDDILDLAVQVDAYPYTVGTHAAEMRGARKVLKWILGRRDEYDIPGVEYRQLDCARCGWTKETYVHRRRIPRLCPECGAADQIGAETVEPR